MSYIGRFYIKQFADEFFLIDLYITASCAAWMSYIGRFYVKQFTYSMKEILSPIWIKFVFYINIMLNRIFFILP